jgi:prepilin-type processing-associated H-X9-DG protein
MKTLSLRAQKGICLLELLIVIAIAAGLYAILFPVFAQVREKAYQTACISNQRQVAMGVLQYATDYDETFPHGNVPIEDGTKNLTWPEALWANRQHLASKPNVGGIFSCPKAPRGRLPGWSTVVGSDAVFTPMQWAGDERPSRPAVSDAQVSEPSSTVMLTDGVDSGQSWFYAIFIADAPDWASGRATAWHDVKVTNPRSPAPGPGIAFSRHSGGANYTFIDGHTEWMKDPRVGDDASHAKMQKFHFDFLRVER